MNMRTFSLLLVFAFVGVCLGGVKKTPPQKPEPEWGGEPLSYWVSQSKDKDWLVRRSAGWDSGRIGPEAKTAIPALIELLKDEDERVREAAGEALVKIKKER
jgi:hypothetical protein